jgi:hypothetical protein
LTTIFGMNVMFADQDQPNLGIFSKKVDYLREHHGRYNVLFIGTSQIYRAIDPVILKQVAADNGCDVRAFNLGVSKLRLTELRYIRDRLPAEMIGDYDLIVLSPMAASGIKAANWASSRIQYFTDWEGYKTSLIDNWEYPTTKREAKLALYSAQLTGAFLYNQLGVGRLASLFEGWPGGADGNEDEVFDGGAVWDASRDGFVALDDETHEQFKNRQNGMLNRVGRFERMRAAPADSRLFEGAMTERAWRRYERSLEHFSHLDVPVLMLMPPMVNQRAKDKALADYASAKGMPLLNYNQTDRYPDLFDNGYWFDYFHTNRAGARAVTEVLGEDICSFMPDRKT